MIFSGSGAYKLFIFPDSKHTICAAYNLVGFPDSEADNPIIFPDSGARSAHALRSAERAGPRVQSADCCGWPRGRDGLCPRHERPAGPPARRYVGRSERVGRSAGQPTGTPSPQQRPRANHVTRMHVTWCTEKGKRMPMTHVFKKCG